MSWTARGGSLARFASASTKSPSWPSQGPAFGFSLAPRRPMPPMPRTWMTCKGARPAFAGDDPAAHAPAPAALELLGSHQKLPFRVRRSGCGSARGAGPCSRAASCFRDVGMAASAHSGRKQRRMVSLRRRDLSGQRDRYGMRLHNRTGFLFHPASGTSPGLQLRIFLLYAVCKEQAGSGARAPRRGDSASGMGTSNVDEEEEPGPRSWAFQHKQQS